MHLKQFICGLPKNLRRPLIKMVSNLEVALWIIKNKPLPAPHYIKVKIISEYAEKFQTRILIETGTYLGQTVDDLEIAFDKIYSIELDKVLHQKAKKMFFKNKNVKIIQGDSAVILPKLINHIRKRSLFWLDAHYSGGITARGSKETPIVKELKSILNSKIKGHVILIDDARSFKGFNDYPTDKELKRFIDRKLPDYEISIENDIIRIHPAIG